MYNTECLSTLVGNILLLSRIDETAKKHIFDKFYQGDSSHKSEGNGLGLDLINLILDFFGGTVTSENIETGGCRFTVRLRK